jgi:hypothetical protein
MYCPQCGSEYRPDFTICSDCQVALVPDRPRKPQEASSAAAADDDSFALIWSGTDPQQHAAVLEILERENIATRTLRGEDHPIFANTHPGFEVYVPATLAAKATEFLKNQEVLAQVEVEQIDEAPVELPAEDDAPGDDDSPRDETNRNPEDATAEIWAGQDPELADMIAMCLRENQILYRNGGVESDEDETQAPNAPEETLEAEATVHRLFVLPEEEARGKEIVREIIDAKPL